jgi:hypothetical protein
MLLCVLGKPDVHHQFARPPLLLHGCLRFSEWWISLVMMLFDVSPMRSKYGTPVYAILASSVGIMGMARCDAQGYACWNQVLLNFLVRHEIVVLPSLFSQLCLA